MKIKVKAIDRNNTKSKHHKPYLTAFGVTPPPRNAATSAQKEPVLSKLTVLPIARRRIIRSDSLVQVNGIAQGGRVEELVLWDRRP